MTPKEHRYRLASAVQKSIRRGNAALAGRLALQLEEAAGSYYARHRLQVICLEDCAADVEQACLAVLATRNIEIGVAELAERVARLTKCRAGDFVLILKDQPDIQAMIEAAKGTPLPDAVATVSELAGLEGFPTQLPAVYDLIRRSDGVLVQDSIPEDPIVCGLPSCSYDAHNAEGKRSAAYFSRACQPLARFLEANPIKDKIAAITDAIFEAEGGLLDCRLTSPEIEALHERAVATWAGPKALGPDRFAELKAIVAANMPTLHRSRQRVVESIDREAAEKSAKAAAGIQTPLPL